MALCATVAAREAMDLALIRGCCSYCMATASVVSAVCCPAKPPACWRSFAHMRQAAKEATALQDSLLSALLFFAFLSCSLLSA